MVSTLMRQHSAIAYKVPIPLCNSYQNLKTVCSVILIFGELIFSGITNYKKCHVEGDNLNVVLYLILVFSVYLILFVLVLIFIDFIKDFF